MRRRAFLGALAAGAVATGTRARAQAPLFLWGRAAWQGNIPAVHVEVQIWWGGQHVSTTYTDDSGYYAFNALPAGFPTDPQVYELRFRASGDRFQHQAVPAGMPMGGEMPPVVIF